MSNTVTICNSSNQILAELLLGEAKFKPSVMYIEFQEGNSPVTDLPTVDPSELDYYLKLRENIGSNRDFLRIRMTGLIGYLLISSVLLPVCVMLMMTVMTE